MDPNDLYYSFSTIAQVLAATTALSAAFAFFRMSSVKELLIGTGIMVSNRLGETGYIFPESEKKYTYRLRDAISRKNIQGIEEIIKRLVEIEKSEGHTTETRPKGLQVLYDRDFRDAKNYLEELNKRTKWTVITSFLTILLSTISLAFVAYIVCANMEILMIIINQVLFISAIILTFRLIWYGLTKRTYLEELEGTSS